MNGDLERCAGGLHGSLRAVWGTDCDCHTSFVTMHRRWESGGWHCWAVLEGTGGAPSLASHGPLMLHSNSSYGNDFPAISSW